MEMVHSDIMTSFSSNTVRKIIHVDMDAFYASVEILDRPELKSVPLIVGGPPNSRSVVTTANYEARKYGIKSAMACSVAARLCPHAIFLPPRFERYKEISQKIREIFFRYTDLVEPLSLDEAYLDVTDNVLGLYATTIARRIKRDVFQELGLTCSAGVAPNKLVAKIASEVHKPNGLTVIQPHEVQDFMAALPVRKIHGVGPATEKRLHELKIFTCRDILNHNVGDLRIRLGSWADWLYNAAQGIDHRPVETHWERKSYGREETFAKDLLGHTALSSCLMPLVEDVCEDLSEQKLTPRTITLKVKYADFTTITRSKTPEHPTSDAQEILFILQNLLKKTDVETRPVRLIGLSVSKFVTANAS